MKTRLATIGTCLTFCFFPEIGLTATLEPNSVKPSGLTVRIDPVGFFVNGLAGFAPPNFAAPVAAGKDTLLGIDQNGSIQQVKNSGSVTTLFGAGDAPDGLVLSNYESVLNVASNKAGTKVYVAFTSDTLPDFVDPADPGSFIVRRLPAPLPGLVAGGFPDPFPLKPIDDLYRPTPGDLSGFPPFIPNFTGVRYQVLYEYDLSGDKLSNPKALAAFEVQSSITGHHGGGLAVTPDGDVLFATGDNLPFGTNGRDAPQDDAEHVSKMFRVDPGDGSVELLAKGLRNTQKLDIFERAGESYVAFADIGGVVSEEINIVKLSDLLDTSKIENYGWGISAGNGREGTFYVGDGIPGVLGTEPPATGVAPIGEAGFIQPYAQFGRLGLPGGPRPFIASSGPVVSDNSFKAISVLFGDLALGDLLASLAPLDAIDADIFLVKLIDAAGNPTSLLKLAGGLRADARFFNFGDGTAGVLLEPTGEYFRLTEVAPVPIPATVLMLGFGLALLAGVRRRRQVGLAY